MRALLSVANRDGITGLARDLLALGVEVFATDGTREHLAGDGVDVASVSDLTKVPPLVGGQVKTFHPAVYAGILARRDVADQLRELEENGIGLIDSPRGPFTIAKNHNPVQDFYLRKVEGKENKSVGVAV